MSTMSWLYQYSVAGIERDAAAHLRMCHELVYYMPRTHICCLSVASIERGAATQLHMCHELVFRVSWDPGCIYTALRASKGVLQHSFAHSRTRVQYATNSYLLLLGVAGIERGAVTHFYMCHELFFDKFVTNSCTIRHKFVTNSCTIRHKLMTESIQRCGPRKGCCNTVSHVSRTRVQDVMNSWLWGGFD